MECATGARGGSGCGTDSGSSDGQAHQRRFSERGLDPAGQHHDAGARRRFDLIDPARAGTGRQYAIAVATPGFGDVACAGGRKEAAGAETCANARAGFARAGCCSPRECCSRSLE